MAGNYSPSADDLHVHDHSRAETGERALAAEDPFDDEEVTSVLDAVWNDLTS